MIADPKKVPGHIKHSIDMYYERRQRPGSFLRAVLENNLFEAVNQSDDDALDNIRHIVSYIHWECPGGKHGSVEAVRRYLEGES